MVHPKLRRVLVFTVLVSVLSLVPAQAASLAPRESRGDSFSARIEHWQAMTWDFLAGLFAKAGSRLQPDGQCLRADSGGH
jgi:hypothetical protein